MISLIAGFILGGLAALTVFGINHIVSTLIIIIPIYILSLLQINNLSKLFSGLLLLGSLFLIIVLQKMDLSGLLMHQ